MAIPSVLKLDFQNDAVWIKFGGPSDTSLIWQAIVSFDTGIDLLATLIYIQHFQ